MTPACMTPEEEAHWRGVGHYAPAARIRPCLDCPASFALEMRSVGRCDGQRPREVTTPRVKTVGRYATEEERREARRRSWRESSRRKKAARRAA